MAKQPLDEYIRVSAVGDRGGDPAYGSPDIQHEAISNWAALRKARVGTEGGGPITAIR